MAFSFPSIGQRSFVRWFRNAPARLANVTVGVGVGALLIGVAVGAAFGDRLLAQGLPIRVSNVPEINGLLGRVARHAVVSQTENPTVATVQSPDQLRQQNPVFYQDVQVGDRLIVWSDRAILYSPSRDRILAEIVTPQTAAAGQQAAPPPSPSELTIEVRNGTGKPGAAQTLADRLKAAKYGVSTVTDAATTYDATTVIPLTDKGKAADPQQVLPLTGGTAAPTAPAGEKASKADILVILGKDQG